MKTRVFPKLGYRPLRRRKALTLCDWLNRLNRWEWPAEIKHLTGRPKPVKADELWQQVMDEILIELGHRVWLILRPSERVARKGGSE